MNIKPYNLRIMEDMSITIEDAAALIQEKYADSIVEGVIAESAVMRMGNRLPDITSGNLTIPILDSLPVARFQNGSGNVKHLTKMKWGNKKIKADYVTVIVPFPKQILDYSGYAFKDAVTRKAVPAIHKAIDGAVLFGVDKPDFWPESIADQIKAAGAVVTASANTYDDLLGVGGVFQKVELSGYDVTGNVAATGMKATLRSLKDNNGHPIFLDNMKDAVRYSLAGTEIFFSKNGSFAGSDIQMISGDFSELVYAVSKDLSVRVLDQATIIDPATKEILYALPQQNMFALLFEMAVGWQMPNPVNAENATEKRLPFAGYAVAAENAASVYGAHNNETSGVVSAGNMYTEPQLSNMTIDQIKAVAAVEGYEITERNKADIIAEFMAAQAAKSVG